MNIPNKRNSLLFPVHFFLSLLYFFCQCSAGCGSGVQRRSVTCLHRLTRRVGEKCSADSKPASQRQCKVKECKKIGMCTYLTMHGIN